MEIAIIAAVARNRVIGSNGKLPWKLSADLRRFKQLTMGFPVLMGRKTWESIGRPLPGRENIVLSRDPAFHAQGCRIFQSLETALQEFSASRTVFVIGGAELYAKAFPIADRLFLTVVEADPEGDAFFPEWNQDGWALVSETRVPADALNEFTARFQEFRREKGSSSGSPNAG